MIPLGCVTGRFQPVHDQHLELFEIALAECRHLVVAVTNPDTGARHPEPTSAHRHTASANPFTYFERVGLLEAALRGRGLAERTTTVPFDLFRPEVWSQYVPLTARQFVRAFSDWERQKAQWFERAGYAVTLLDGDPSERLSSSDIRARMGAGDDSWHRLVPAVTKPLLDELLERAPMGERR
ncbi:MAG: adenylyltransferase/cytidyltransferase family protein [Acidimicrobiia bacterium]